MTSEQISDLREAHVTCLRQSRESLRQASLLLWAAAWGESPIPATWQDIPDASLRYLRVENDALVVQPTAHQYTVETATELWILALAMNREVGVSLPQHAAPMVAFPADASGQEAWDRWVLALHNS